MASREGMIVKFFDKWKEKRLNSFAKKMLKDNPGIEKYLKRMDDAAKEVIKDLEKSKNNVQ